jgi:hypothetical protein
MTSEEAFLMAAQLLDERGQLLNAHLFRLVDGDKELFREVRDRLVSLGKAEDRSGVGLVRIDSSSSDPQANHVAYDRESTEGTTEGTAEWWLMNSGAIRGPMDLVTLCRMRQRGELLLSDVVRRGAQGAWRPLDEVPLLAAAKPVQRGIASQASVVPGEKDSFVPLEKSWSLGKQNRSGVAGRVWNVAAGIVGGSGRLKGLILSFAALGLFMYWWNLPPSSGTIYREFVTCRSVFKRLQDRRAKREDWQEAAARYRPRIQYILDRLKPRATGKHPLENALYLAGTQGVLLAIDSPGGFNDPDPQFEKHMKIARNLLDGLPAE